MDYKVRYINEDHLIQGNFAQRHFGRQLVLKAVGIDENAVVFFLQPLHFQRHLPPVGTKFPVRCLQGRLTVRLQQQRQTGEVPGGLVGVPVNFGKAYKSPNFFFYRVNVALFQRNNR